jgi:gliding motility-associated-like protein
MAGDPSVSLGQVYTNTINPQVVYARVTNSDTECFEFVEVILKVEQLPLVTLEETYRLCVDVNGNPIPEVDGSISPPLLETGLDPSLFDIVWEYPGGTAFGPSIVATEGGSYTVTYTEIASGCSATVTTTVTVSQPPETYEAVLINGAFADNDSLQATATGLGTYVFQLDNGLFIESGLFENVSPGVHTITIKDVNGCGSVTIDVGVIDYPRFFTPNQDGFHDTWNIIGIAAFDPTAKIYIFDRFGKLLKQVSPLGIGWDGTYNGNPLPSSDYWFVVEYNEEGLQKEFKGHFTLKR